VNTAAPPRLDAPVLESLEHTAVRLARLAGEHIAASLGSQVAVHFKEARRGCASNSNPVSELDREIEQLLRGELERAHPDHGIVGEEFGASVRASPFTWALDPIDGTTNFINGVPLCASSIGALWDGWPVAGAIWCATTHALRPGVYHARRGGLLQFEGTPLVRRTAGAWRGLADTGGAPHFGKGWDTRVLGSATLELALTAAGLLRIARLSRPSLWDAAAGLTLIEAAGCEAVTLESGEWQPLRRFLGPQSSPREVSAWCQPVVAGEAAELHRALELLARKA
jgi:myo-inositol-1(or 4)-monophosphatase